MIDKKLDIIESIDAGSSYMVKAEKYSTCIARLTGANITKDASKVEAFKESREMGFDRQLEKE